MLNRLATWVVLGSFSLGASAQAGGPFVNTLMPEPRQLSSGDGVVPWSASFSVATPGFHDDRLDAGLVRMLGRLEDATGSVLGKEIRREAGNATLVVDVAGAGEPVQSVGEDESYSLRVGASGMRLQARTVVGALRGMETVQQLLQMTPAGYFFPTVTIDDAPRFAWRGLMIDCGRHFEPVAVLERMLDGMAAVKLNVLHWHLSEDQGFRMESKVFPKLTGMGSDGKFYTQEQARAVVAYARARGIRVVPEFDMPGHARSWFVGYPELASGPAARGGLYTIRREFGIDDAAIDPTRESTYEFLDKFIGEMADLFPDPYFHIGGDESNGKQWKQSASIQEFMRAHSLRDAAALQAYFNQRLAKILAKYGKRMVGWDEVLTPGLPKTAVVQLWRGAQSLEAGARLRYEGILSQPYYLDAMRPAETLYLADPLPATSGLSDAERKQVLGGEICMWAEQLDSRSIESRVWPRSAAIAERFWSAEQLRDVDDMYRRLGVESLRLEAVGLRHVTHEEQALRILADSTQIEPLRHFAEVLEPISFGERYEEQRTSQLTPLTGLVDAVRPDPPSRHAFEVATNTFLAGPASAGTARQQLEQMYRALADESPAIQRQVMTTPLLRVAQAKADELPRLAEAGLEAVHLLASGAKAPAGWKRRQRDLMATAEEKRALVRFTFLPSLQRLVGAVPD